MKKNVRIGLVFAPLAIALAGFGRFPDFLLDSSEHRAVLSDKPMVLGTKPIRLSTNGQVKVLGVTSDLCVTLSNDARNSDDFDTEYAKLRGGAHLLAMLHARDGRDYKWACNAWRFTPNGSGLGTLDACMRWECFQAPPKGTEISSIDLSSDRPLHVLGVIWSSTGAFDFVSQPPPDPIGRPSAEYADLEHAFDNHAAWSSEAKPALQINLSSNRRRASFSTFNSTLLLRMADFGIQLQPTSNTVGMHVVTIPASAVEACSMTCSSNLARETDLLLPGPGIQLGALNSPRLIDWCWSHHIPMATSASMRAWLYHGTPLPAKNGYAAQFVSRATYDNQTHRSCMGY